MVERELTLSEHTNVILRNNSNRIKRKTFFESARQVDLLAHCFTASMADGMSVSRIVCVRVCVSDCDTCVGVCV